MPRVQQASRSSALTPRIIASTRSNWALSRTSRQAAPMQKRVAPPALARRAAARTSSTSINPRGRTGPEPTLSCRLPPRRFGDEEEGQPDQAPRGEVTVERPAGAFAFGGGPFGGGRLILGEGRGRGQPHAQAHCHRQERGDDSSA